jgi:hypothetical protein
MANYNKAKKYHFIYKTTNLINSKYYIGMHSTNNLEDGYLGSGKKLRRSINKYGVENFKCEILEFLTDRDTLAKREKEIVNEELLKDPNCMNLKEGGHGGFDLINLNGLNNKSNQCSLGGLAFTKRLRTDSDLLLRYQEHGRLQIKRLYDLGKVKHDNFKGKCHNNETKQKMSISSKGKCIGETNSQYGTCWITNGIDNKKIKKENLETFLNLGWKRGRIFI